MCSLVPNLIPAVEALERMAMANGSITSTNSRGELGQPCLQPLDKEKSVERTHTSIIPMSLITCSNAVAAFDNEVILGDKRSNTGFQTKLKSPLKMH